MVTIKPLNDPAFAKYGRVLEGYDYQELLDTLRGVSKQPADAVIYEPGCAALEELEAAAFLRDHVYGGMSIQVGYCNGCNHTLNCLEYHRGAEVNIPADDVVLLIAPLQQIVDGALDTSNVEAFLVPAQTAVLLYETTLHYAPCNAPGKGGFRVTIVLPEGTNTKKPAIQNASEEDQLLWARNKWLLAHPDSPEAGQGAYIGLIGENLTV